MFVIMATFIFWLYYNLDNYPVQGIDEASKTSTNKSNSIVGVDQEYRPLYTVLKKWEKPLFYGSVFVIFAVVVILCLYYLNIFCRKILSRNRGNSLLEDKKAPSGLINLSESCYMNSLFQSTASSEVLIKEYCDINQNRGLSKLKLLIKILKDINTPADRETCDRTNSEDLQRLMKEVGWDRPSQEDVFQCLSSVINAIQREVNDAIHPKKMTIPPKFRLLHSFTEDPNFNKVQDHLALAVPLCGDFRERPGVEINSLLDEFFSPSKIDDGPHETQIYLFEEAPSVLLLHIQANEWSVERGEYIKPSYFIQYGEIMKYTFDIHKSKDRSRMEKLKVEYKLTAVVHHMGGVGGGHYVTYRKNKGEWYLTNDQQVERVKFDNTVVPYIMVYEKIKEKINEKIKQKIN